MLLYFHIPFCDSKCHYCSFNSYTNLHYLQDQYFNALIKQLDYEFKRFDINRKKIKTIFIGGGTPSSVKANLYEKIFKKLEPFLTSDIEITIEANPNSLSKEWIKQLKKFGVNRVSIGVQSFDEKKLKFLGRNHTKKEAIKAIKNSFEVGIKNISIDLIYDTYIDTKELLKEDLKIAFSLPINHLSAYSLTIEKGTKFYKDSHQNIQLKNEKYTKWFIDNIKERFNQYEISNFGRYQSKHNLGYWRLEDYIGIGSGAVGFLKNKRYYPTQNIQAYIKNPLNIKEEKLTVQDIKIEKIFLGLRSIVGVELDILDKKELQRVKLLEEEDKIFIQNNRFFNKNYLISDEIALFLIQD